MKTITLNHDQAVLLYNHLIDKEPERLSRSEVHRLPKRLYLAENEDESWDLLEGNIPMNFPFTIWDDVKISFVKDNNLDIAAQNKFLSDIGITQTSSQTSPRK